MQQRLLGWPFLLSTGLLLSTAVAHAQSKVAVIDMQRTISETNEGARAIDGLKKLFDKRQVELDSKQTQLFKEKTDLEKRCRAKSVPQEQCEKNMEELQRKLVEWQNLTMEYQKEIQKKQGEVTQPIVGKLLGLVRRLAQRDGYDMVVDKGFAHYERKDLDLTDLVIKTYNTESNVPPPAAPSGPAKTGPAGGKEGPASKLMISPFSQQQPAPVKK